MRGLVGLYFAIGVALVAIGFLVPGPCLNRNTDIVNQIVFVLTWPVGLYSEVYQGHLSAEEWLRAQACGRGWPARAENGAGLAEPEIRTGAAP